MHPRTGDDHGEACQENAGDAATDARQQRRQAQRHRPPGDADVHRGSIALEGALRADANALYRPRRHNHARDAQRPQAIGSQRRAVRDHMLCHVGRQRPSDQPNAQPENDMDAHGAAHGLQQARKVASSAVAGNLLNVRVAESRGQDRPRGDRRRCDRPYPVPLDAEVAQNDRRDQ